MPLFWDRDVMGGLFIGEADGGPEIGEPEARAIRRLNPEAAALADSIHRLGDRVAYGRSGVVHRITYGWPSLCWDGGPITQPVTVARKDMRGRLAVAAEEARSDPYAAESGLAAALAQAARLLA